MVPVLHTHAPVATGMTRARTPWGRYSAGASVVAVALAIGADAARPQSVCYRPAQPYPYAPPAGDREFSEFVNGQYQRYMLEIETYLNRHFPGEAAN